ncbi:MAG: histidine kinase, partial [Bacteroidota bacterium]
MPQSFRPTEIFIHVLGWALYLLGFGVLTTAEIDAYPEVPWLFHWRGVLFALLIFYTIYLILIPEFLGKRRYAIFSAGMLLLVFGYPALRTWLDFWLVRHVLDGPVTLSFFIDGIQAGFEEVGEENMGLNFPAEIHTLNFSVSYFSRLGLVLILILSASITRFTFDWFRNQEERGRLERERLNSEVSFLRSQVNPHFLFNTLNNIY